MFEMHKNLQKVGYFPRFPRISLCQALIKVWCKSGVKSEMAQYQRCSFTPKHPFFVVMYEISASMVKWHHTSLVRTNSLVSKGWRHQIG